MRLFSKPQIIHINKKQINKAKRFSEQVVGTVDYSDSNQQSKSKIKDDHFISKIGEEAVAAVFKRFTSNITGPDYTIYHGDSKSWDSDLRIFDTDLAVKTQKKSSASKYSLSWTFQYSATRKDPIMNNLEGWICFVQFDDETNAICKVFPPYQVKELTFKDPRLKHLYGKKRVVYACDLPVIK